MFLTRMLLGENILKVQVIITKNKGIDSYEKETKSIKQMLSLKK